jgi:ABC-type phosphate transport system substrate-binding protein
LIASDPAEIGYGSLDENPSTRGVAIKAGLASVAVAPTIPTIRSLQYPISRHIYWSIPAAASSAMREFCTWALSSEEQLVAEGAGFEPVLPAERTAGIAKLGLKDAGQTIAAAR